MMRIRLTLQLDINGRRRELRGDDDVVREYVPEARVDFANHHPVGFVIPQPGYFPDQAADSPCERSTPADGRPAQMRMRWGDLATG
jgi:hypothetical protein